MIDIIPAIDLIDGKCVRLTQGDYAQKKVYNENPLEVAKSFEAAGIRRLHLVDLDGAKAQHIVNHRVLHQITTQTSLVVDFGGGLKTDADLRIAFDNGASMITGGSIAVKDPEIFERWIVDNGAVKKTKKFAPVDITSYNFNPMGSYEDSTLLHIRDNNSRSEELNNVASNIVLLKKDPELKIVAISTLFILGERYFFNVLYDENMRISKLFEYIPSDNSIQEVASVRTGSINHVELYEPQ